MAYNYLFMNVFLLLLAYGKCDVRAREGKCQFVFKEDATYPFPFN